MIASLAIGLGVHFGTQSEPESPMDIFVREMSKASEENTNTENKETIINDKEYELIEENKIFCGGTNQADAQTKLETFHDAYQQEQTFFIKPHSITSTKGTKKTFSHYRGETNVEKNCWEVEVPEYPAGIRAHPTEAQGRLFATIRFNIDKRKDVDKNYVDSSSDYVQLIIDSGIYCSNLSISSGLATDYLNGALNGALSNYKIIPGATLAAPLTFTGDYSYFNGEARSTNLNCWRIIPKTTEATE